MSICLKRPHAKTDGTISKTDLITSIMIEEKREIDSFYTGLVDDQ